MELVHKGLNRKTSSAISNSRNQAKQLLLLQNIKLSQLLEQYADDAPLYGPIDFGRKKPKLIKPK